MIFSFYTLGCKANQFDTQAMERMVSRRGHSVAAFHEAWDVCVINTCTVTATSDKKSRQVIRQARRANPDGIVAVCGCYAQMSPEDVQKLDTDVVGGATGKDAFLDAIEAAYETKQKALLQTKYTRQTPFEILESGCLSGRTRALMKVQDGCDNYCTYCIIPYSRGHVRSMPLETAVEQIKKLQEEGYHETVITGIEISSYGVDLPGKPGLADVIETVAKAAPDMRIRLGSLEPTVITEDFCRRLADTGKLCRHFHLSLQSGCDRTLKAMNRKYDTAQFYRAVELLREYFPGCALTCDLITGFPGETEEDQAATLEFIRKCGFADMHIFPYSRRPGTPADKMAGQNTTALKARRAKEAQKVSEEMRLEYMHSFVGKELDVLFESEDEGGFVGHSDNYLSVWAAGEALRGTMRRVRVVSCEGSVLRGIVTD